FGHERGVYPVLEGYFLHRQAERHDVVRHGEGIRVADDDLVLRRRHLVVAVLHRDPHHLQGIDRAPAVLLGHVERGQVEVAAAVEDPRFGARVLEVEELQFGSDVERVTEGGRLVEVALQDPAGVAPERLPVRRVDVAEHAGDLLVLPPGKHGEGRRVGPGEHVGFLHPGVTVAGRPVEGHALIERHLELRRADRDRLQEALDVGEPEADDPDNSLLVGAEDVAGLFGHVATGWGTRQHYAVSAVSPSRREVNTRTTVPPRATPTTTRIPTGKLVASVTAATAAGPAMNPTRLPRVRAARPVPSEKPR